MNSFTFSRAFSVFVVMSVSFLVLCQAPTARPGFEWQVSF